MKIALLKGRANYVCPYHLERALADGRFLTREDAADARRISVFAKVTRTGDKAEWAPRIATGSATLLKTAISGKGAMPPRGGGVDLSDAELKAAVDYLVSKAK